MIWSFGSEFSNSCFNSNAKKYLYNYRGNGYMCDVVRVNVCARAFMSISTGFLCYFSVVSQLNEYDLRGSKLHVSTSWMWSWIGFFDIKRPNWVCRLCFYNEDWLHLSLQLMWMLCCAFIVCRIHSGLQIVLWVLSAFLLGFFPGICVQGHPKIVGGVNVHCWVLYG